MAGTSFGVNDALTNKRWSRILFEETLKDTVAYRFMGETGESLFQMLDECEHAPGDKITVGLRMQLKNDPKVGAQALRGFEEPLIFYNDSLLIDLARNGVLITNADMTRQRVPYNVRDEARTGLQDYFVGLMDQWVFNQLCGYTPQALLGWTGQNSPIAPDANHHIFTSTNTADEQITAAGASNVNMIQLTDIDRLILKAKTLTPMIRPIMVNGKKHYVLFMHPQQAEDLRTNTNTGAWYDIQKAMLQGGEGKNSLIFQDALGVYHNTLMVEDVRVTNGVVSTNAATPVTTVRRAVFCGAQSLEMAFGREKGARGQKNSPPIFWREQMDDYEQQLGVSANLIGGMKKAQFNNADFGCITYSVYSAS